MLPAPRPQHKPGPGPAHAPGWLIVRLGLGGVPRPPAAAPGKPKAQPCPPRLGPSPIPDPRPGACGGKAVCQSCKGQAGGSSLGQRRTKADPQRVSPRAVWTLTSGWSETPGCTGGLRLHSRALSAPSAQSPSSCSRLTRTVCAVAPPPVVPKPLPQGTAQSPGAHGAQGCAGLSARKGRVPAGHGLSARSWWLGLCSPQMEAAHWGPGHPWSMPCRPHS